MLSKVLDGPSDTFGDVGDWASAEAGTINDRMSALNLFTGFLLLGCGGETFGRAI
jgi:hypothetical protein